MTPEVADVRGFLADLPAFLVLFFRRFCTARDPTGVSESLESHSFCGYGRYSPFPFPLQSR